MPIRFSVHQKVPNKSDVRETEAGSYIVQETVQRLLDNKSPKEAAKLKILDIACGSGSFLIGVYQKLLDWHLNWYVTNDFDKHSKGKDGKIYRGKDGWRLTVSERKRILLNNIFGVDVDSQAVEVTKLSLLLKVLEGESSESINSQEPVSNFVFKAYHDAKESLCQYDANPHSKASWINHSSCLTSFSPSSSTSRSPRSSSVTC